MNSQPDRPAHNPADVKAVVNRQFSQVAANYSTSAVHARGEDLSQMVHHAALSGRERMLDAGCGAGHTAFTFAPHVREIVAVDLSAAMLEQCRQQAEARGVTNVDFRQGDVEQLSLPDGAFDLVTSRYSAHHWPHPQQALAEFHRVLKPGGRLLLSDIVSHTDFTTDTFLQAIELLRDTSHVRDHRVEEWQTLFHGAGFVVEVVFAWNLRLEFDDWVERMATPAPNVALIRTLLDQAPGEVRSALRVESDHSFTLPGALLRATRS